MQELIDFLTAQNQLLEQQISLLRRIDFTLQQILISLPVSAPNYQVDISKFPDFNWSAIAAHVQARDRYGATQVFWRGHTFTRRAPENKFGAAIWFSRCTGKGDDGQNVYETLIKFKRMNLQVEPMPEQVLSSLAANPR